MAQSTEELRREIEQARTGVGEALEAIGDRVAPKKVVERAKENVAEKVEEVKDKVSPGRIVKRNTLSLRHTLGRMVGHDDTETKDVVHVGSTAGFRNAAGRNEIGGSASPRSLTDKAGSAAGSVADSARSAPQAVRQRAEGNPVAAGLFVLAAGFFVGSLLPPTERERELTRRARSEIEPLKDQLAETGRSIAGELQQSAQQSLEEVKGSATQAAQTVKEEAGARAQTVKAQAQEATTEVKGETTAASGRVKAGAKRSAGAVKAQASQAKAQTKASTRSTKAPGPPARKAPPTVKKAPAAKRPSGVGAGAPRL